MTMPAEVDFAALEGVTLWRRIADELKADIASGALPVDSRLPGEAALAERFGVNRHTVRAALKALDREGLVRARQGSGTFVCATPLANLGLPNGDRLSAGIAGVFAGAEGRLLSATIEAATPAVAAALWLPADELVTRMETLTLAEGVPVTRTTSWFSAERFPAIDAVYGELGSVAAALSHYDVSECVRTTTRLSARRADLEEARVLGLSPASIVLVTEGVDVLPEGQPVEYSLARFSADRVELVVLGE
jgi:GntR family phosphonate transport system transcriptional regulator